MLVIGAGYGRTGTTSLKLALEDLGYPCYHMEEVMKNYRRGHIEQWTELFNERAVPDWADLFEGYEATVDFPACVYYRELMQAFPDAVVLLSVRDSEGWWKSFSPLARLALNTRFLSFLPMFRSFSKLSRSLFESFFDRDRGTKAQQGGRILELPGGVRIVREVGRFRLYRVDARGPC